MRTILSGRAFPAAFVMVFASWAAATAASAQSVALSARPVADHASWGLLERSETSFVLIEHKAGGVATGGMRLRRITVPPVILPKTVSRQRSNSSAARDRVIVQIIAAEARHGLPSGLLDALVAAESNYRPYAMSKAGAAGLAQLMPATARSVGVFDRFDVRANLDGGAKYLRLMIDKFGSISAALAAYNAGPGAVVRARGIPRNGETPRYVARVLGHWSSLWP